MTSHHHDIPTEINEIAHTLLHEEELVENSSHRKGEHLALLFRNIAVGIAAALFLSSFFFHEHVGLLRGIGYLAGALAYFCELLMLTDFFSGEIDHREMFMVYCFGPLYVLLGLSYLFGIH